VPIFVTPEGLASGDENLNMALACQLFYAQSAQESLRVKEKEVDHLTRKTIVLEGGDLEFEDAETSEIVRKKREEEKRKKEEDDLRRKKEDEELHSKYEQQAKQRELELEAMMAQKLKDREAELEKQMQDRLKAKEEEERKKFDQGSEELKKKEEQLRIQEEEAAARRKKEDDEMRKRKEEDDLRRQKEADELKALKMAIQPEPVVSQRTVVENVSKLSFEMESNRAGWRKVFVTIFQGRELVACNISNGQSDPFVVGKHYDGDGNLKVKMKTKIIGMNRHNPYWDETMEFRDFQDSDYLSLTVWDDGKTGYDFMGEIRLERNEITHAHKGWFALKDLPKKQKAYHPGQEAKKKEDKDKHKHHEDDDEKKKGVFSKMTTGVKQVKDSLVKKEGLAADTILDSVSKSRNVIKTKIRGKKIITGDLQLSFETIF